MMNSIVTNQRPILLHIQGTNIWSGQNVQQYNTLVRPFVFLAIIADLG